MSRNNLFIILSFFVLSIVLYGCTKQDQSSPSPSSKPGTVQGSVSNEFGQALNGASVTLMRNGINSQIQTTNGNFRFDSSPKPT